MISLKIRRVSRGIAAGVLLHVALFMNLITHDVIQELCDKLVKVSISPICHKMTLKNCSCDLGDFKIKYGTLILNSLNVHG